MGCTSTVESKPHLVIIGASFAGIGLLTELKDEFRITVVDKKDCFEWICGAPHNIMAEPEYFEENGTANLHNALEVDRVFGQNVNFIQGILDEVIDEKTIRIKRTKGKTGSQIASVKGMKLTYDFLAICTGGFWSINETPEDMYNVYTKEERANLFDRYRNEIDRASSVLVVGGGPTGVESVGELLMKYGSSKDKKIGIATNADHLLHGYPKEAGKMAEKHFEKNGVKVYTKTRYEPNTPLAEEYDYIFNCVGLHFNASFLDANYSDFKDARGRIYVNKHFQVTNVNPVGASNSKNAKVLSNVFCYGDAALTPRNEIKNVPAIKECTPVVVHNLKELKKESPSLIEIPDKINFYSGVYFDKDAGAMTANESVNSNPTMFTDKKGYEDMYIGLMKDKEGYREKFGMKAN